jgi:hypothetical protein
MKFFFRFLITTLFLILIYIVYRSEIHWKGIQRTYYLIYYIGTLLAIFFSIICTYLNVKIQKYILIIFISVIFSFYSFEGKLIFYEKKTNLNFQKKTNLNFDVRSPYEVFEDLKKTYSNVTISVAPTNFLFFKELDFLSLAGISKAKTISCNENGYYSIYQSDRFGFNNPDKEWDSKEIEYLLVGDSFTHGDCVNMPNDISSVLRNLSKKTVINLGYKGNGPLIEYATLREYLTPNTKNVLWLYFEGNDLANLKDELKNKILNKYLTNQEFKQDLKFKQNQIDQFLTIFVTIEKDRENVREFHNTKIMKFIKLYNIRGLLNQLLPPTELRVILKLAKELVEDNNGKLYFIYLPEFHRYKKIINFNKNNSKQKIKKIVNDLSIEFIDIDEEVFKKEKNPLKLFPFELDGHYNVEGYKKVAVKIYEKTK